MELFLASILLGIAPMAIYALLVWRVDCWEKEPFHLVLAAFLWGAVPSILFAVIAQAVLGWPLSPQDAGASPLMSELYQASIVAPLTEEIVKGLGVWLIALIFRREIDSVLDGLVYGSLVGFGFAAVENVFYFLGQSDPFSLLVLFFFRAFVFGMMHALFTGLTGVGIALGLFARPGPMKMLWPGFGLALAMGTHGLHNYFATMGGGHLLLAVLGIGMGLLWFVVMVAVCLAHENRWIRIQLSEEVAAGVLRAGQALDAAQFWKRSSLGLFHLGFTRGLQRLRLLRQATKLAFAKQRRTRMHPGSTGIDARIATLREEVRLLSAADPLALSDEIPAGMALPPPLPPVRRRHGFRSDRV